MILGSIIVELNWEDNLGLFEGPIDYEQDGFMFSFELRLSVEEDNIFGGIGTSEMLIDDLIVFDPRGREITDDEHYDKVKNAITWF